MRKMTLTFYSGKVLFKSTWLQKSNDALVNIDLLKVIVYQNKVIIRHENRNQNLLRS